MAAEVVGTAYVRIRAVTTKLGAEIADAVDKGAKDANPAVEKAGVSVGDSFTKGIKSNIGDGVSDAVGDAIRRTDKDHRGLFSRVGASFSRAFYASFTKDSDKNIGTAIKRIGNSIDKGVKTLAKFKLPLPFWLGFFGLPALVGTGKAILFYIGGLVGQIGTLLQILSATGAAGFAAFLSVAAGVGLVISALKAETPQLEAFKKNLEGIGKQWKSVAEATQGTLFPGLTAALRTLTRGLVPVFRDLGKQIGTVYSNTAQATAAILTSGDAIETWDVFKQSTVAVNRNLGRIIEALARTFVPLMKTLAPLGAVLSEAIANMADRLAEVTQIASDNGTLTEFFAGGLARALQFFGALGDIIVAIKNILKIGSQDIGFDSFNTFDEFAARFRTFTESLEGQNKIKAFFDEAKPVMQEVNGLIKDIFVLFGQGINTGTGSDNIVSFISMLREKLPGVADLIRDVSDALNSPAAGAFVGQLFDLIEAVIRADTLLPTLQVLTALVEGLIVLLNTPVIGDIVTALLTFSIVAGTVARVIKGVGLVALLKAVGSGLLFFAGGLSGTTAAAGSGGPILILLNKLGLALAPLVGIPGLIIAGLAALGAVFYFVFEPVRNLIDGIWTKFQELLDLFRDGQWGEALKKLGSLIIDLMLLPFTFTVAAAKGAADKIVQFFQNLPGWISTAFDAVWGFLQTVPGRIGDFLSSAAETLGGWVSEATPIVLQKLQEWGGAIVGWITGTAIPWVISSVVGLAESILSWITNAIAAAPGKLGELFGTIVAFIINFVIELPGRMLSLAESFWNWSVEAVKLVIPKMGDLLSSIISWITGTLIPTVGNSLVSLALTVWNWVTDAVAQAPAKLVQIFDAIKNFFTELPNNIGDFVTSGLPDLARTGISIVNGIVNGIANFVTSGVPALFEAAKNFVTSFGNAIVDLVGTIVDKSKEFVVGFLSGLGDNLSDGSKDFIKKAADFFTGLPGTIIGALGNLGELLWGWITGAWDYVINTAWPAYVETIKFIWTELPGKIIGWLGDLGAKIWGWITGAWSYVTDTAWPAYVETIKYIWTELPGKILEWLGDLGETIWGWITGAWDWIVNTAWPAYVETIKFIWVELPGKIIGWLGDFGSMLLGWVQGGFNWVVDRMESVAQGLLNWFTGLPDRLKTAAGDLFGFITENFKSGINALIDLWNRLSIPSFTIGGWSTPFGDLPSWDSPQIDFPDIPKLASGGIVQNVPGGIFANIGEGRFKEAVMPLPPGVLEGLKSIATGRNANLPGVGTQPQPLIGHVTMNQIEPEETMIELTNRLRGLQYRRG